LSETPVLTVRHPTRKLTFYTIQRKDGSASWRDMKRVETIFIGKLVDVPRHPRISLGHIRIVAFLRLGWMKRVIRIPCPKFFMPMPCRPLCGLDLWRPHFTCIFFCRIRRSYYQKMPASHELEGLYQVFIAKNRHPVKRVMFKYLATLLEWCAS